MATLVRWLQAFAVATLAVAALSVVGGVLFAHFHGGTTTGHAVGYALWIGGGIVGLLVGGSGSPSRNAVEGRWGYFGQYWGSNAALPQSPLWLVPVSFAVIALGIVVFLYG
jgi:hypothetical protein